MKFPSYAEYRESREAQWGSLPAHWDILPIKRLASLRSGDSITSEQIEAEGDYPVYGGNGLRGFANAYTHDGHFALIGRQGALCGNVNFASGKFWASEHAVVVSPTKLLSIIWIGEVLRSMNLNQYSVSAAQPGLSVEAVSNLRIPVPPFSEQQAIASFLAYETAKIDALVEVQKRLIELLKEKRQAVISQAVTKGLDATVPMKDSGIEWLGQVPKSCSFKRLKFVADVQTGVAKGKDNTGTQTTSVPYLRVANVQDGYLDLEDIAQIEIPLGDVTRYRLKAGDVLMNEGGDFDKLGRGHIWDGSIDPCIHQNHVFAVRPFGVSSKWLNTVTGAAYAQFYFMSRSKQSTNLASISSTNVMDLPIAIPPSSEQEKLLKWIEDQTKFIDRMAADAEGSVSLLQERRSALISAAVTGKIDVRGLAIPTAGA